MPTSLPVARRTPARLRPFVAPACTALLALSGGAAPAQPADARHDVLASCPQAQHLLQRELERTWWREREYGTMDVHFVVTAGQVTAVGTRSGLSIRAMGDVRRAVGRLECPGAPAGTSVYRMQLVFADPDRAADDAAGIEPPRRIALVERR